MSKEKETIAATPEEVAAAAITAVEEAQKGGISILIPCFSFMGFDSRALAEAVASWNWLIDKHHVVLVGDVDPGVEGASFIQMDLPESSDDAVMVEVLKEAIGMSEVTDQFVYATHSMILLKNVTMAHIALPKVAVDKYPRTLPCFFDKEKVVRHFKCYAELSCEKKAEFINLCILHEMGEPVKLGPWKEDSWVLPVRSDNPSKDALEIYGNSHLFLHYAVYSDALHDYLVCKRPGKA